MSLTFFKKRACESVDGYQTFMASPQCLHGTGQKVTEKICYPSTDEVLRLTKNVVLKTKAKVVFVATDRFPLIKELENHLKAQKVTIIKFQPVV